ncbi:protein PLASTID MOVEMENT IMPAIRED 2-like isoform X2 [Telopea speciosissima]|uniref:protein PLASTID MOVEMENT IMPAIRED 2-like isoform X2 n=1 Tax=Telopea speciosissima TaxID=54955 RepID=UPI001CC5ED40|nr:protein PLASTID MOVEMENT IMPAIRED 2-like isoform X2 [Telopea speciosissima]
MYFEYDNRDAMDRAEATDRMQIGSGKTVVGLYAERMNEENPQRKKTQMAFSDVQKSTSRAKELHLAKRDIGLLNENRMVAESVKDQAESELYSARMRVKGLTSRIEESNLKAKAQKCEVEKLQKQGKHDNVLTVTFRKADDYQYAQVMRELEFVKQKLSKLKLERDSVLEAKLLADKEFEDSFSRLKSHSSTVESLMKEIEEINEEQILVQLARIEAVKELGTIEAQREAKASHFSEKLERIRNRIKDTTQELDHAKELESELAITISDVDVLQNELKLVKAMKERVEEPQTSRLLQPITGELDAAKKELARIREEEFQLMASMDIIRDELQHVSEESTQLRTLEENADLLLRSLNSKLFRGKSKLKAAFTAEEKAKTIVSNLSATLQQLQAEAKAANRERELVSEEAASIRTEIQETESKNGLAEDMLQAAMKELEAVKASEAITLERLKALREKTLKARASESQHKSSVTISTFEYEYLTSCAEGAKEIADKKIVAAQAWTDALKASEKEILINCETAQREIRELMPVKKQEVYRTEKSMKVKWQH